MESVKWKVCLRCSHKLWKKRTYEIDKRLTDRNLNKNTGNLLTIAFLGGYRETKKRSNNQNMSEDDRKRHKDTERKRRKSFPTLKIKSGAADKNRVITSYISNSWNIRKRKNNFSSHWGRKTYSYFTEYFTVHHTSLLQLWSVTSLNSASIIWSQ